MSSLPQANWPTELDIEVEDFDGLFYKSVPTQLLANSLIKKDIWRTIDDLKLGINLHDKVLTLKFNKIQVKWLNLLSKLYVLVRSKQNLSPRYLRAEISYLVRFSRFIQQNTILRVEQLSDQFFDDFDVYLKSFSLSDGSKSHQYMTLINFFDLCRLEGWLDVNTYWFRGRWKGSPPNNSQIDYIPESVWKQLDEKLDYLPEPLQRMVLIIRATGLRIGELLN
jgi:integrase